MKMLKQLGSSALTILLTIVAVIGGVIIGLNNLNSSLQTTSTNLSSEVASVSADLTADPVISASGAGAGAGAGAGTGDGAGEGAGAGEGEGEGAGEGAVTLCNYKATISSEFSYTDSQITGINFDYTGSFTGTESENCNASDLATAFSDGTKGTAVVVFPTNVADYDCKNDFPGYHTITAIADLMESIDYYDHTLVAHTPRYLFYSLNQYLYLPLAEGIETGGSVNYNSSSSQTLLELHTPIGDGEQSTSFDLMYNQNSVISTSVNTVAEFFNEATCFISWKDVGNEAITGITDDHKQMVLTNIETKLTALNSDLATLTNNITLVDSSGDFGEGVYPYGSDNNTYDYEAITTNLSHINQLIAYSNENGNDNFTYKAGYAMHAYIYGEELSELYNMNFDTTIDPFPMITKLQNTESFLYDTALAPFNDYECQLTINIDVTADNSSGTTEYTYDTTILSNNGGGCPENILAVAIDKITNENSDFLYNSLPITSESEGEPTVTYSTCVEEINKDPNNQYHFIEININAPVDFPSENMTFKIKSGALSQDEGNYLYNYYTGTDISDVTPPNGDVELSITVARTTDESSDIDYTFNIAGISNQLEGIYHDGNVTIDMPRICFSWYNTPLE